MFIIVAFFRGLFCGSPYPVQQEPTSQIYPPSSDERHNNQLYNYPPRPRRIQINQQNGYYASLRAWANVEGDQMAKYFQESHEAYSRGNGALAKDLSNKGKEHQKTMEIYNQTASEWIFAENNKDSRSGVIDLHGLYVKEAIAYTDRALQDARQRRDSELRLIVGKGLHSLGGTKIKPAIEEIMERNQLKVDLDAGNAGVLVIHLNSESGGVKTAEIIQLLEKGNECIIM